MRKLWQISNVYGPGEMLPGPVVIRSRDHPVIQPNFAGTSSTHT